MMDWSKEIEKLKKEKNAVILAHNYELPEVQDIADFVGDSLGLSIEASKTDAQVIVFCGVFFMAETAKILSPQKVVLIPEPEAGCPMADMISASQLLDLQKRYPEAATLCYVNTKAEVKAECDFCCTSANATEVVEKGLSSASSIIFVPDQYLANYVSRKTGREFITWPGYCPVHAAISEKDIERAKKLHPHAEVLVHPECRPEVTEKADQVLSTEGMCRYIKSSPQDEFIVGTEVGILHRLQKENPAKHFYPVSEEAICPDMKKINQEKIALALQDMKYQVELPEKIIQKAARSIERMLQFT
ncbi:MAG: quinolinate synthase [Candidatus Atribacteria bacterium]|nr:quinolinate synthase [Candidatus Atribacteria bacterium]